MELRDPFQNVTEECPGCGRKIEVHEPMTADNWLREPWWCRDCGGSAMTVRDAGIRRLELDIAADIARFPRRRA